MPESALLGQKPASHFDALVVEGFWRFAYSVDHKIGPQELKPHPPMIPIKRPANAKNESRAYETYGASGALLALTILITGTRLILRLTRKELRWGPDDWAVIVGAAFIIAYAAESISTCTHGGGGKHMWDVTHKEFDYWAVVCLPFLLLSCILSFRLSERYTEEEDAIRENQSNFSEHRVCNLADTQALPDSRPRSLVLLCRSRLSKDEHLPLQPASHWPDLSKMVNLPLRSPHSHLSLHPRRDLWHDTPVFSGLDNFSLQRHRRPQLHHHMHRRHGHDHSFQLHSYCLGRVLDPCPTHCDVARQDDEVAAGSTVFLVQYRKYELSGGDHESESYTEE